MRSEPADEHGQPYSGRRPVVQQPARFVVDFEVHVVSSTPVSGFALSLLLSFMQPPVLPPEPEPPSSASEQPPASVPPPVTPPASDPPSLPESIEPIEFPLEAGPPAEPLPRMEPSPSSQAPSERRAIVDLRDPFNRPPLRPRSEGSHLLAQERLLMPDLKDPFAEGNRPVRSRTLDLRVPSDLRDPFRDGLGRERAGACVRTTPDGTVVQGPGVRPTECGDASKDLRDPFRDAKLPPP